MEIKQRKTRKSTDSKKVDENIVESESDRSCCRCVCVTIILLFFFCAMFVTFLTIQLHMKGQLSSTWKSLKKRFEKREMIYLTPEKLAKYDGTDPKLPIYLAIRGRIYDVTAGAQHYGPGGGYSFFAGKDASRAYVTGCFTKPECLTDYVDDFDEKQMKSLQSWVDFYDNHEKYFHVGYVVKPKKASKSDISKTDS
jgi:predicted heme/steroid binding protein